MCVGGRGMSVKCVKRRTLCNDLVFINSSASVHVYVNLMLSYDHCLLVQLYMIVVIHCSTCMTIDKHVHVACETDHTQDGVSFMYFYKFYIDQAFV